jgi:hypothetical protein
MEGEILGTNQAMLGLVASMGFSIHTSADDPTIKQVVKVL